MVKIAFQQIQYSIVHMQRRITVLGHPHRGSAQLHGIKAHGEMGTLIGPTKLPNSSTIYGTRPGFQSSAHSVSPDFC